MKIVDNCQKEAMWCVVQCYGLSNTHEINASLDAARENGICQKPLGAVAIPAIDRQILKQFKAPELGNTVGEHQIEMSTYEDVILSKAEDLKQFTGKAFCFLPLKDNTKFNFHYNSHFVLDRARTSICIDGVKGKWNMLVLKEIVAKAWIYGMEAIKKEIGVNVKRVNKWRTVNHIMRLFQTFLPLNKNHYEKLNTLLAGYIYETVSREQTMLFPVVMHSKDVLKRNDILYPFNIKQQIPSNQTFILLWTGLANDENQFGGVFNNTKVNVYSHQYLSVDNHSTYRNEESYIIGNSLKMLGMKLIELPMLVYTSIASYNVPVKCTSPGQVATFLATCDSKDDGSCSFGPVDVKIDRTLLQKKSSFINLLSYILSDQHHSSSTSSNKDGQYRDNSSSAINKQISPAEILSGLPLCITCDDVVRRFDKNMPVLWSRYGHLVPNSLNRFLDKDLQLTLGTIKTKLDKAGFIEDFGIATLLELLPLSYSTELLTTPANVFWSKADNQPFSEDWLREFYSFLVEISQSVYSYQTHGYSFKDSAKQYMLQTDDKKFTQNILQFHKWALIPSVKHSSDNEVYELVPIYKHEHVLNIDLRYTDCVTIMRKVNLPLLDKSVFEKESRVLDKRTEALGSFIATMANPCSFLRYLSHYKELINCSNLTTGDGHALLMYFNTHFDTLTDPNAVDMIRGLALFETIHGHLKALVSFSDAVVLPRDVPIKGLLKWSEKSEILLLCENDGVKHIYERLKLASIDGIKFYTNYLITNINELPMDSIMVHIEYIRDAILPRLDNTKDIDRVIHTLSDVKFIEVNGIYRKCKELFLQSNEVFRAMIDESLFLPEQFTSGKWLTFLIQLGLNVSVSTSHLIQFANQIAMSGVHYVSEKTKSQSEVLVKFIDSSRQDWHDEQFYRIKDIKFILPKQIGEEYNAIFPQLANGERLVCFNGSIPYFHYRKCWTSLHMLPYPGCKRQITADMCDRLGILRSPTMSAVISHCQNICDSIDRMLQRRDIMHDNLKNIFLQMYKFMLNNKDSIGDKEKQMLSNTKCVLVSDYVSKVIMLVKAEDIVIELNPDDEIKPYLWRITDELARYCDVFLRLGSVRDVGLPNYVAVLLQIKTEFPEVIPPAKMEQVTKCLKGIVKHLKSVNENIEIQSRMVLYLPNRQEKLVKSTDLIISDNAELEIRLGDNHRYDYFIGFENLRLHVSDPIAPFKRLPTHLRPRILTELIDEVVCLDSLSTRNCQFASRLEDFLRCPEMMQGVVRLVKHQCQVDKIEFGNDDEINITSALANIHVERVTGLQTKIEFEGNAIPFSGRDKTCFIQQHLQGGIRVLTLYFQINEENTHLGELMAKLKDQKDGVIDLLDKCAAGLMKKDTYKFLSSILKEMEDPNNIKVMLDNNQIAQYNLLNDVRGSVYPPPGTYVPQHFFPFLERSILFFKEHEFRYVAYDIGEFDSSLDDYNEVYIYAHINRLVNPECSDLVAAKYEIEIRADSPIVVSIYRLFKFVPQTVGETGTDVAVYDSEPIGTVPFDENCRRIRQMLIDAWKLPEEDKRRVIRRLKLKWHPDKNPTNMEYAHKVYNYMTFVILELERTGTVGTKQCYTKPDMSNSAYSSMSHNVYNTGCRYAQARRDNVDAYRTSNNGGQFSHSRARNTKCPDVCNAKRWYKQANIDLQMAQWSFTVAGSVHGYNWICYNCHQACEKGLKAAGFAEDGNSVNQTSHSLSSLACQFSNMKLTQLVQTLESSLGHHCALRYPDACIHPKIPSDVYTDGHAFKALDLTKQILDIVYEIIYQ